MIRQTARDAKEFHDGQHPRVRWEGEHLEFVNEFSRKAAKAQRIPAGQAARLSSRGFDLFVANDVPIQRTWEGA